MGVKGFQPGHETSAETRAKISKALDGEFFAKCDCCGKKYHTKKSAFLRRNRHFCTRSCYSKYRAEILPKEEQPSFGTGFSGEERKKRAKARSTFNHFMRDNHIERQPCEVCGAKAEAHHDDYDKPLEVRWLCFKHHREWHKIHENPELLGGNEDG